MFLILMLLNDEQPLNALKPMLVNVPNSQLSREAQDMNAPSPMLVALIATIEGSASQP